MGFMTADLFDFQAGKAKKTPLADRLRPDTLKRFVGQQHLIGEGCLLRKAVESDNLPSMIFWGPPGSGKTTLAYLLAKMTNAEFISFSAVAAGLAKLKKVLAKAKDNLKFQKKSTILFIDEIHRWNKLQQDALLPYVEDGSITLIGATTENPSFEVISALLSRVRVFLLEPLAIEDLVIILKTALEDEKIGLGSLKIKADDKLLEELAGLSNGDARTALNALEFAAIKVQHGELTSDVIKEALAKTHLLYDRAGEEHYNIISALHKSIRGGDVNGALYWLARMLEAGEDPLYIARRLVRAASEDIGLADPEALVQAVAAYEAAHFLGMPECNVVLAQAVVYLTKAPKSNTLYISYEAVKRDTAELPAYPVPLHLRNAPTKLMKDIGYGKGYIYPPDNVQEAKQQTYLPPELQEKSWWQKNQNAKAEPKTNKRQNDKEK